MVELIDGPASDRAIVWIKSTYNMGKSKLFTYLGMRSNKILIIPPPKDIRDFNSMRGPEHEAIVIDSYADWSWTKA